MSETQTLTPPGSEPPAADALRTFPETAPAAEPNADDVAATAAAEAAAAEATKNRGDRRFAQVSARAAADRARAEAAETELRDLRARAAPKELTPEQQRDADVDARARQIAAQDASRRDFEAWNTEGSKADPKFVENCNSLAAMGGNNPSLVQALLNVDDAHKVVASLASDPDELERILALSPARIATAIGKLSAKLDGAPSPAPKPVSGAPAPIKPLARGTANADPDPDKGSFAEYQKWYAAQEKARTSRRF